MFFIVIKTAILGRILLVANNGYDAKAHKQAHNRSYRRCSLCPDAAVRWSTPALFCRPSRDSASDNYGAGP
jgi:hypothetical protein